MAGAAGWRGLSGGLQRLIDGQEVPVESSGLHSYVVWPKLGQVEPCCLLS